MPANDSIWGATGARLASGKNASYPLYFVIIAETATVGNGEPSEPIFTALRMFSFHMLHLFPLY